MKNPAAEELVAYPLDLQVAPEAVSADGFPIDRKLQRRARRIAIAYCGLGLYYVGVMPFALRFVRWQSLSTLAADLLARADVLAVLLLHVATNAILAACAWRVIAMRRWTSWVVVGAATLATAAASAWIGRGLLLAIGGWGEQSSALGPAISVLLLLSYLACLVGLWRVVAAFDVQRARALAEFEGVVRSPN